MAKTPNEWMCYIRTLCLRMGLSAHDAEECIAETLMRYQQKRGVYPWDEDIPSDTLLRMLARDVACELMRVLTRRQRLEAAYCALQHALHAQNPSPEACAIANAEAERFRESLPPYLRRTLELLEMGYTPAEIARQLNICISTVYTYFRDLKARFVKYFGYDPRIQGSHVGIRIISGSRVSALPNTHEEVNDDETTEDVADKRISANDCKCDCDAAHPSCLSRNRRGGGGKVLAGCGCSAKHFAMSEAEVKRLLSDYQDASVLPAASSVGRGGVCATSCCSFFWYDPTLCQDCCGRCCAGYRASCYTACYAGCLACAVPVY